MPSLSEQLENIDLPKVQPLVIPASVGLVAGQLDVTLSLTCRSVPEQYEVMRNGKPAGYIRADNGHLLVSYPDAGGEDIYDGHVEGFGGFTDSEREQKLLLALGLIAAQLLK